ncbi:MAG: hypothetical protein M1838_005140, partial [Thelocarpon superellum]
PATDAAPTITASTAPSTAPITEPSAQPISAPNAGDSGNSSRVYKATFTEYSGCGANTTCAFTTSPGYSAAISQFLYGGTSGKGPECGTCWKLTADTDSSENAFGKTMAVMISGECPAEGNPSCAQIDGSVNAQGGKVNFDLCSDSGSARVFFPNGGGLGIGTGEEVDCTESQGSIQQV